MRTKTGEKSPDSVTTKEGLQKKNMVAVIKLKRVSGKDTSG